MGSINKVILVGNLGKNPEVRYAANGDAVANVALATSEKWKGKDGQSQEKTEWHRVVFFKQLAEIVQQYLKKGSQVYVEGRLQTRRWDDNGTDRYTTEIIADKMQMLDRPSQDNGDAQEVPSKSQMKRHEAQGKKDIDDSEIPF